MQKIYSVGQNVTTEKYNFQRAERFKYLGMKITTDNDVREDKRENSGPQ